MAASDPRAPIAIPISLLAMTGALLMPSLTNAVFCVFSACFYRFPGVLLCPRVGVQLKPGQTEVPQIKPAPCSDDSRIAK